MKEQVDVGDTSDVHQNNDFSDFSVCYTRDISSTVKVKEPKVLTIFHQNTQSLRNKIVNIEALLLTDLKDVDILCFSEHWMKYCEIECVKLS